MQACARPGKEGLEALPGDMGMSRWSNGMVLSLGDLAILAPFTPLYTTRMTTFGSLTHILPFDHSWPVVFLAC